MARNRRETIDAIIEHLGTPDARRQVSQTIKKSFDGFDRCDRSFSRVGREERRASARAIIGSIAALQTELRNAPGLLLNYAFWPPPPRGPLTTEAEVRTSLIGPLEAEVRALLARPARERAAFEYILKGVKQRFVRFLKTEAGGEHGEEADRLQGHCARLAYNLMIAFSNKRISGHGDGAYCQIASLLCEYRTSREGVDLRRRCVAIMREMAKRGPLVEPSLR